MLHSDLERRAKRLALGYFGKWRGSDIPSVGTPSPTSTVCVWSFVGAFLGIAIVTALDRSQYFYSEHGWAAMIGSFGATSVLVYGTIESPLSQPVNVVGGHTISALVGVAIQKLFIWVTGAESPNYAAYDRLRWFSAALAVAISIVAMQVTRTTHPPGGATALIATTSGPSIYREGFFFVVSPVLLGSVIMLCIAILVDNIQRRYPIYYVRPSKKPVSVHHHHHHHYHGSLLAESDRERLEAEAVGKAGISSAEVLHTHHHYPSNKTAESPLIHIARKPVAESSRMNAFTGPESEPEPGNKVRLEEKEALSGAVSPGREYEEWDRALASYGREPATLLLVGSVGTEAAGESVEMDNV